MTTGAFLNSLAECGVGGKPLARCRTNYGRPLPRGTTRNAVHSPQYVERRASPVPESLVRAKMGLRLRQRPLCWRRHVISRAGSSAALSAGPNMSQS
jgi:hypothetical protein